MKKLSILMVPKAGGKIREFKIPSLFLVFLVLILLSGSISIYMVVKGIQPFQIEKNELANLQTENQNLEIQLNDMTKKIILLKKKIDKLAHKEGEIKKLADIVEDYNPEQTASSKGKTAFDNQQKINFKIENLQSLSRFYDSLFKRISLNKSAIYHTPTVRPIGNNAYISARFGLRKDPFSGKIKPHQGVDFSYEVGTPIGATASGTVSFTGKEKSFGRVIRINHGSGFETMYAHLQDIYVKMGQKVKKGQKIGTLGNTGRSIGPHLHYEVIKDGEHVNPEDYF